jgi:hypothetical protein
MAIGDKLNLSAHVYNEFIESGITAGAVAEIKQFTHF